MKLSGAAYKMIVTIGICFVVIAVLGFSAQIFFFEGFGALLFAVGALLGCALSALKVYLLDRTVSKSLTLEAQDAKNYIGVHVFIRFILTGVVLAIAIFIDPVALWGAALGILTLQISAFSIRNYKDEIISQSEAMEQTELIEQTDKALDNPKE